MIMRSLIIIVSTADAILEQFIQLIRNDELTFFVGDFTNNFR